MATKKVHKTSSTCAVSIARLEEQLVAHETADSKMFDSLTAQLSALNVTVSEIDRKLSNQKGFFAGVTFVISGIVALVATVINYIPWKP